MAAAPGRSRAELVLSLGVLALGLGATAVAFSLPEGGGYARIGPNFVPKVVAGGLILLGIWLLAEYSTGGWRDANGSCAAASVAAAASVKRRRFMEPPGVPLTGVFWVGGRQDNRTQRGPGGRQGRRG